VGLDAVGETAGSEGVRFGCGIVWVEVVLICAGLVLFLGGEGRGTGDFDLDRERGWKMASVVDDREMEPPGKANGKERDRECELGVETGEVVAELDVVLASSVRGTPGMVIGCVEVAPGKGEDEAFDPFISLVCWSAATVDATERTKSEGVSRQ
jgi:hypothetical protein